MLILLIIYFILKPVISSSHAWVEWLWIDVQLPCRARVSRFKCRQGTAVPSRFIESGYWVCQKPLDDALSERSDIIDTENVICTKNSTDKADSRFTVKLVTQGGDWLGHNFQVGPLDLLFAVFLSFSFFQSFFLYLLLLSYNFISFL